MTASLPRRYLRARDWGVLATVSARLGGYPFGSIVTYATDHAGRPFVCVSALAEHTRNMSADPRVSIIVRDRDADPQAGARLTLVGDAERCMPDDALRERLLRLAPAWRDSLALGDFGFFRIAPKTLRFIEGFGAIRWVRAEDYIAPPSALAEIEAGALAHMNADHADAVRALAGGDAAATMVGIDCDGCDIAGANGRLRIDFDAPVGDAPSLRTTLAALSRRARGG